MESAFEGYLHCPKSSEINDAYLQMDTSHAATETFQTASHSHDWAEVCHVAQARVYVVSLENGEKLWSYEIGQPVGSSPAVVDGKIVIGSDDGGVYCFAARR